MKTGVIPGTTCCFRTTCLRSHWGNGVKQATSTEIAALVATRFQALIGIRNVKARSGLNREMGTMETLVVAKCSDIGVAAGSRGLRGGCGWVVLDFLEVGGGAVEGF